jgi:1,5-anhydro-D-fructose reductase (1,5-anhydro-D-mannitol-forming)
MIRVAMLSFWHVHAGDYLRQATNNPGTEVVAVWDEEPDRGKAKAAEIGVEFAPDLDALLARGDVDAVICDTPTNLHHDVLVKAAKAGKHIFTEKVLAPTLAEANEILAAVDAAGVVLTLSLPRLYDPYTQTVDEVIASGRLGQLTLARVRLSHGGAIANWLPEHFYSKEQTLGGALIDLGCHPMYLTAKFLGGLPDTVSATYGYVSGREVEDSAVAVLSYPNGAIGVAEAGFVNKMNPFEIEIHGTEGSLFFGTPEAKLLVRADGDDGFTEIPIGDRLPMAFDQWVQAVENGGKTDENIAHGLSLTKLMDASNRSAASGQAISVADLPA